MRRFDPRDDYWRHGRYYGKHRRYYERPRHHIPRHRYEKRHYRRPWLDCVLRGGFYVRFGRGWGSRYFDVPRYIDYGPAYDPSYDEYYYGAVYDGYRDAWLDVYLFPVYHYDRVEYRPYVYCEGRYLGVGRFDHGGLIDIDIEIDLF